MSINDTIFNTYLDYNREHTKMATLTNRSCNILLIKDDIIYNRCHDLEDNITSTIRIEVKLPKNKRILVSAIYHQWSLPKILNIINSNNIHNQTLPWHTVLNKWQKAHSKNKEIIVMTDDNMDHNNQNFNNSYKISNIKEITHKFLTDNNYTI